MIISPYSASFRADVIMYYQW